jgi:integrase
MLHLFVQYQAEQPEDYPYVFIPTRRYDFIQQLRAEDRWTVEDGVSPINNFDDAFKKILNRAGVENGTFHDLRRTCLTNWFVNGLSEYEVMNLAGHACFATTHEFYLAVREDLIERGRAASTKAMAAISFANLL